MALMAKNQAGGVSQEAFAHRLQGGAEPAGEGSQSDCEASSSMQRLPILTTNVGA